MNSYPPLKFVDQVESFITLPYQKNVESLVNIKSMKYIESYLKTNRFNFLKDYMLLRLPDEDVFSKQNILKHYMNLQKEYSRVLGLADLVDTEDFIDLIAFYSVRNDWRSNKLSYIVNNNLFDVLLDMKVPKQAPTDALVKLPSSCFYIDYNNRGSEICEDLLGSFVSSSQNENSVVLLLTHLIYSKKQSRVLYLTTPFSLDHDSEESFIPVSDFVDCEILCEDGITRTIDGKNLANFIFNFLVYLNASNKDVKISERTRKAHDSKPKAIKNKFKEVKEFEVGFIYGKTISKDAIRIKYVDDKETIHSRGTSVCSHYRSAHWHHYWVGSGDNKKLITKWIEGIFVNTGKPLSKNVKVHKVK